MEPEGGGGQWARGLAVFRVPVSGRVVAVQVTPRGTQGPQCHECGGTGQMVTERPGPATTRPGGGRTLTTR